MRISAAGVPGSRWGRQTKGLHMLDTVSSRMLSPGLSVPVLRDHQPVGGQELRSRVITVCHPVWQLGCGGLERQLVEVVNRLPQETFRHIVVVRGWDESSERIGGDLAEHIELIKDRGPSQDRTWSRRLACILREQHVDVLHVRGLSMLMDSVMAAELHGELAVACSFHGFESADTQFGGIRRKVLREALLRCNDRWAVSEAAAGAISKRLNLPRESFGVLPNGVDTIRYQPAKDTAAVRRELGLPLHPTVLLSVGTLKAVKGHEVLLRAMETLDAGAEDIVLVLVGDDKLDGSLQRQAAKKLPALDVRFVGKQADVLPWYQAADVFILPSLWEGASNALLEAMSCGKAVIATRVGGNEDVVRDERTGFLVEAGDATGLREAMRRMLADPGLRACLAAAGRREVHRRFSMENTLEAYASRYQRLVAEVVSEPVGKVSGR